MPKYHTNVEGMQGTGDPIVPQGAVPVEEGKEPAEKTGGAFSGMQVTEHVMEQIKQGSAADFFSFKPVEGDPGKYDMIPKLPEYGCDGPGQPVFKLRENQNRLMKGFAKKMFNESGELDPAGGAKFIKEYQARFGLDASNMFVPYCPEMPLETDRKVLQESALDWLCEELEIPNEEKAGFKNYGRAVLDFSPIHNDAHKISDAPFTPNGKPSQFIDGLNGLGQGNFVELWLNNLEACIEAQELEKTHGSQPKEPGKENIFERNIRQYHEAVDELRSYAQIDPKNEMKILVPTECSGSSRMGVRFTSLANNANIALGKQVKGDENTSFNIHIAGKINADLEGPGEVEKKLQALEGKKDTLDEAEYNRQKTQLETDLANAEKAKAEVKKKQEGHNTTTKWDMHHAPVVGSFTDDEGKKHYLTIEAFAPEADTLMDHPAVTSGVAIGVYSGQEDFVDYYYKDNPFTEKNPESMEFLRQHEINAKSNTLNQPIETVVDKVPGLQKFGYIDELRNKYSAEYKKGTAEVDKQIEEDLKGEEWDDGYESRKENTRYSPTMGMPSRLYSQDQEEFSKLIREATVRATGVPEEYREKFDKFLSTCEGMLHKNANYGKAYLAHNYMRRDEESGSEKDLDIQNVMRRDENGVSLSLYDDEPILDGTMTEMNTVIKKMIAGKPYSLKEDARDYGAALRLYFEKNGIKPDEFEKFVNDISSTMKPVTEARMDIQAAYPEIANSFMQKDVWHLDAREREFASQNMDVTLNSVFSKAQKEELSSKGMDIYDCIYIDGKSANEYFGNKFASVSGDVDEFKKADVMKQILAGCQVEFARTDEKGAVDIIRLNAFSDVPSIENALSRQRYLDQPKPDFSKEIRDHQAGLRSGEIKKEGTYSPQFKVNTKIDERFFNELSGFNQWAGTMKGNDGQVNPNVKAAFDETGYKVGLEIVSKLTGINSEKDIAGADFKSINAAMSQICVDGMPYTYTFDGGINKDNYKEVLGKFADRFSAQFDENKPAPMQNIGVLENGKLKAITYDPPEPVPPTTKVHWYSSKATRTARRNEERAYQEQQARADKWKERNADATNKAAAQDKLRQQAVDMNVDLQTKGGKDKVQVVRKITMVEMMEKEQAKRNAKKPEHHERVNKQPEPKPLKPSNSKGK